MDADKIGGRAICSPARNERIMDVARAVRVIATLIPAAMQSVEIVGEMLGNTKHKARPNAAPAVKNGKMKPPRNPPATVKEIAINFPNPAMRHLAHVSISNPIKPDVGQTCGKSAAGSILARTGTSHSPQNCNHRFSGIRSAEYSRFKPKCVSP